MEKIGLYFGSFNPIHVGHLILAEYISEHSDLDKIWFVVSPHNPLKIQSSLADNQIRLHLTRLAIEDNPNFFVSDVEFSLPTPSYTINTLKFLKENYTDCEFSLIMGQDNLESLDKWKDYEQIAENYRIFVYPRKEAGKNIPQTDKIISRNNLLFSENNLLTSRKNFPISNIVKINAPMIDISSSFIRQLIKDGKSIRYLVADKVREEIENNGLFK